jgi:hypothetical protein
MRLQSEINYILIIVGLHYKINKARASTINCIKEIRSYNVLKTIDSSVHLKLQKLTKNLMNYMVVKPDHCLNGKY